LPLGSARFIVSQSSLLGALSQLFRHKDLLELELFCDLVDALG